MTLPPRTDDETQTGFFRCQVTPDRANATIRVGRRRLQASVQETSIDGFTVLVTPRNAGKLKVGRTWVLEHDGSVVEIYPQWFFNSPDGHVQMGLRRMQDLTPPDPYRNSLLARVIGRKRMTPNVSAAAYGGFVMLVFCLFALPGLGDRLGTSAKIQQAFNSLCTEVSRTWDGYR